LKLAAKRGCNLELPERMVDMLAQKEPFAERYRDHDLSGDYAGFRECHIQPDWLLIYRVNHKELILFRSRTGRHSDSFDQVKNTSQRLFTAAGVFSQCQCC